MMWASTITFVIFGACLISAAFRENGAADIAVRLVMGVWCLACAVAIWERIP